MLGAIDASLLVIENRRQINEFTAILILSDGQDTCGNNLDQILSAMKSRDQKIQEKGKVDYQIHSFGYGQDHDEKVLSAMREFKNGKFYYISSDEIVDECFIDCLSDLMTVIGKEVEIEVKLTEEAHFLQTPGKQWNGQDNRVRTIKLNNLLSDQSNEFLCFV